MEKKSPFCTLSDAELTQKAKELIQELIDSGGKSWVMNIPARPNSDPDLIFAELNYRFVERLKAQPGAGWVKASERLPEPDQRVMVYNEGLFLVFLKFWPAGFKNNDEPCFIDLNDKGPYGLDEITHWAPLPLGPDESAAGREDAVEQGAIAFADWGNKNVKGFDPIEEKWVYGEDEKRYTTAQLYTIFKQQKEK